MKLKFKLKWWYYNSWLSKVLWSKFGIITKFTKDELLEIPIMKKTVNDYSRKFKEQCGNSIQISTELKPINRIAISYLCINKKEESITIQLCPPVKPIL